METKELVKSIIAMQYAEVINLSDSNITSLPPEIAILTRVERLYLNNNLLRTLPEEIKFLTTLKELTLDRNQIETLPPEIGTLTKLRILSINENRLLSIPPEIGNLTYLRELYLNDNQLESLPIEIGCLNNLTLLYICANRLTRLPAEIGFMTSLRTLLLNENQLSSLPAEIGRLKGLNKLALFLNPLKIPPEIMGKSNEPQAIITYYLSHYAVAAKTHPLNEAKVLVVGQGAVGKSSIVSRLIWDFFNPSETKTEGIDIHRWHVPVEGKIISLNVWDFGGQEILHATHQFFLTRRSLYLLVLDSRIDESANRVEYWLKLIHAYGAGSPIIVVCNKCDEHSIELNWRGLKEKYPYIKAFVKRVSCLTGEGIKELGSLIAKESAQIEHVGDPLLINWFEVKDQLASMSEKNTDLLTYSDYEQICSMNNVSDNDSQRTLMGYLHDLGIALNFPEHPLFVLNPEWVTRGVYQILNSNPLFQNKGILFRHDLLNILDHKRYPIDKHLFIIDLMRRFELLFDFEGSFNDKLLVPDLLPKEEPDTGNWDDCMGFQYHYDILPGTILSRFIVRMHGHISKHTYWRTGVVLKWAEGPNRALVKADIEEAKIFIAVIGNPRTRRNCLFAIRSCFSEIHDGIPGLRIQEKIPLHKNPKVLVDYQHLLNLEKHGIDQFIPEGLDPPQSVNVWELVDGIEPVEEGLDQAKGKGLQIHFHKAMYEETTLQQIWLDSKGSLELQTLAEELKNLRQELVNEAKEPEHYEALADIAKAEKEARGGNGPKALEWLKKAGKWTLTKAGDIGTKVAAEAIKKALGL